MKSIMKDHYHYWHMTARSVLCPTCGAPAGESCRKTRNRAGGFINRPMGVRVQSEHSARVKAAAKTCGGHAFTLACARDKPELWRMHYQTKFFGDADA